MWVFSFKWKGLLVCFRGYNAHIVYFEDLKVDEQMQVALCTDVLIGVQGAGLQWLVTCMLITTELRVKRKENIINRQPLCSKTLRAYSHLFPLVKQKRDRKRKRSKIKQKRSKNKGQTSMKILLLRMFSLSLNTV